VNKKYTGTFKNGKKISNEWDTGWLDETEWSLVQEVQWCSIQWKD
jgi:hypothetical protein